MSGVLTNYSVDAPEHSNVELNLMTERDNRLNAESQTFRKWQFLPWDQKSTTGVSLAKWEQITVTLIRARDPQSGTLVVQATLGFRLSGLGYASASAHGGKSLYVSIWFRDKNEGLLEAWHVTESLKVNCGDKNRYLEFKAPMVSPDWYDLLASCIIIQDGSNWSSC